MRISHTEETTRSVAAGLVRGEVEWSRGRGRVRARARYGGAEGRTSTTTATYPGRLFRDCLSEKVSLFARAREKAMARPGWRTWGRWPRGTERNDGAPKPRPMDREAEEPLAPCSDSACWSLPVAVVVVVVAAAVADDARPRTASARSTKPTTDGRAVAVVVAAGVAAAVAADGWCRRTRRRGRREPRARPAERTG